MSASTLLFRCVAGLAGGLILLVLVEIRLVMSVRLDHLKEGQAHLKADHQRFGEMVTEAEIKIAILQHWRDNHPAEHAQLLKEIDKLERLIRQEQQRRADQGRLAHHPPDNPQP